MAVNYGAGASSAMAAQYADLRQAIASKGDAENRREARNIESKGLFGTGIKSSDIQDFGNIAIKGAALGDARMGKKMDRARTSFDRRMKADERRLKTLQKRVDAGLDPEGTDAGEIKKLQFGMGERRNSFEDFMGKYQEKGLWGTKFGSEDVGYRTEGESRYSQALGRDKPGSGSGGGSVPKEFTDVRDLGDFDRSPSQPGIDQEFRGGSDIGENAPNEYEEKFGEVDQGPSGEYLDKWGRPGRYASTFPGRDGFLGTNLGKKKDNLGDSVTPISGGMAGGPPQVSATSNKFVDSPPSGGPPKRDNYSRALRDALPQAGLSTEELAARDAAEKQELLKEKYLVGQKKQEYGDQMKNLLAKRKTNKLKDLVSSTFRN